MSRRFVLLPALVLFSIVAAGAAAGQAAIPEPSGWYAGDMHVHRSCGGSPVPLSSIYGSMAPQNLAAVSLLADMGNGEVQTPSTDLPLVNGQDASISTPGRIVHWDAEWHWDATYTQYAHQALGGHLVGLGLTEAHQIWQESTFPIIDWAHQQNAIMGFAHMQYLDDSFPTSLTCCTPIEYPVEVGLGSADFISEDVNGSDSAINAYYRLLNSGFRPGFAAGTDYPCNDGVTVGSPLTYVRVADGQMTYRNWTDGISNGRTVVSRNGHNEFLDLKVNSSAGPGDEVDITGGGTVQVTVQWTAIQNLSGTIEIVSNGAVVASKQASVTSSSAASLTTSISFPKSGWIAARRTGSNGHVVHTAAVFVVVDGAPIRVNATDPQFYVQWMNNLLTNTSSGGTWHSFFPTSLAAAQARFQAARAVYQQIAREAQGTGPTLSSIAVAPSAVSVAPGKTQQFTATGTYSDNSTVNLTGQVTWASSNPSVATVNLRGLVAGVTTGSTVISATLGHISGTATASVYASSVTITTQSLPDGTVNAAYSAPVAATGGVTPYTWSIISGALPTGLSLNAGSGVISGTPSVSGSFNFTVQVQDSSGPAQVATKAFTVAIAGGGSGGGPCPCSIWPATTAPAVGDSGPDSAVELGVKFRADTNGYINGIRFYKGAGNTGTHIGSLWSSSGTLLASATFTNETSSGWQQVNFATPVAVTANTVYVASYHTNVGHYAADESYFLTTGVDTPPLHALKDGVSGANGVYAYSLNSAFPNQAYRSTNYWVDVVFVGSATLKSIAVTPGTPSIQTGKTQQFTATGTYSDGATPNITSNASWSSSNSAVATISSSGLATGVATGTSTITASFGGASGTATLTVTAGPLVVGTTTLAGAVQNQPYSATLAASGGTLPYTWSMATGSVLPAGLSLSAAGQITGTPTVTGNFSFTVQVADSGSPKQVATQSLTLAIAGQSLNVSLWATAVPNTIDSGPDAALELGVKFTADVNGTVSGIRFYKAATNTGTHTASLWNASGTRLATATFTNETASGWQQVNFAAPVSVAANTTYVASYHTNVGHYSDDVNYFTAPLDAPPLHVPINGGVYAYGSSSVFPNQSWNASNYWVDLVFVSGTADTTPPSVVSVSPASGAYGVDPQTTLTARFSEALDPSTITASSFVLIDANNSPVAASLTYDSNTYTATLTPTSVLSYSTVYRGTLRGGSIKDRSGNGLASDYSWSFTTSAQPPAPPNEGPGGPILIVSSATNPFSRYYTEMLRAEGLNEFTAMDISLVTSSTLAAYDVVILGDFALNAAQASMFTNWVNGGGNLIAMHPDGQLASVLGVQDTGTALSDAYLSVNTSKAPGTGIVGQTIQFHGPARRYTLNGAATLATLYSDAATATANPAVTLASTGSGQAAAFTYDLARSVVYTRQGNPAWSGQERDGTAPVRSDDLYFGGTQADWVDFNKVHIPQADEQQRLLANLILLMNQRNKPLLRFWYLPRMLKAAVVMTGDDHGNNGTAGRFDNEIADSPAGCSVDNWECVRSTSYLFPGTPLSDSAAASYRRQGFEIGVHVNTNCIDWTSMSNLDSFYTAQLAAWVSDLPSLPSPVTHRTHCITWSDYDSQPQVELSHGIRFDANYYYWPGSWVEDRPGMFTGSGMPMRFAKRDGTLIDVYQAATQMTDESDQSYPLHINTLLDNALGSSGYYGVFTANMHTDTAASAGSDAIIASAQARGVPIVTASQMLTWLDGRNGSSFGNIAWQNGTLTFNIVVGAGANGLQAMLPATSNSRALSSLTRNGAPASYTVQAIKGISYAVFAALPGSYVAQYGTGPALTVTSVTLNPSSVSAGTSSTGTVTLSGTASADVVVALGSNDPAATVPATVTVSAGSSSATFTVATGSVPSSKTVAITASYAGSTASADLTIAAVVALSAVSLNPSTLIGGSSSTGTVTLTTAPATDVSVSLQSGDASFVNVPTTVTVVAGDTSATFQVSTSATATVRTVAVSASYSGVTKSSNLTVNPAPTLSTVTLNPTTVTGGSASTATVTLTGPAISDTVVTLQSSDTTVATVPSAVTVVAGTTAATFTVTTTAVNATQSVTVSAAYSGVTKTATLTINPVVLNSISLSPATVVGGSTSTATLTLSQAAPTGGAVVSVSSANTSIATVPSSVTVAAGSTTATFNVTTSPVSSASPVVISASFNGTKTATLTVNPPALSSVTLNPTGVTGGATSTGTVTLSGPAGAVGVTVTLTTSNTVVARVPANVTVPAGSRTATFAVSTSPVAANTTVTVSGIYSGVTRTANLTVRAPALQSVSVNPTSVKGGTSSTGTVTLNGAAPSAGVVVRLSSNRAAATVPSSVTVTAGKTTATFTISTSTVTSSRTATISGTYGTVTRSASLTVNP